MVINNQTDAVSGSVIDGEFLPLEEDHHDDDEFVNEVKNTQSDVNTFGVGGAYSFNNGYIGVSYSDYESEYGVPNHEDSIISIEKEKYHLRHYRT